MIRCSLNNEVEREDVEENGRGLSWRKRVSGKISSPCLRFLFFIISANKNRSLFLSHIYTAHLEIIKVFFNSSTDAQVNCLKTIVKFTLKLTCCGRTFTERGNTHKDRYVCLHSFIFNIYLVVFLFNTVIYVFLLLCFIVRLFTYCIFMYLLYVYVFLLYVYLSSSYQLALFGYPDWGFSVLVPHL
jgi:hypothetical protein